VPPKSVRELTWTLLHAAIFPNGLRSYRRGGREVGMVGVSVAVANVAHVNAHL